jgi:LPS sulfotransferase NodH
MVTVSQVHSISFDQPRYVEPPRIYVIASQPRTGSHYLAQLLRSTGEAGVPLEYFHTAHWKRWVKRCGQYNPPSAFSILCQLRTTPNGVFGMKAHWKQFQFACRLRLENNLSDATFIQINRDDVLGQAISLVVATQSGAWISDHQTQRKPEYSFVSIQKAVGQLIAERAEWDRFFALSSIEPLRISYEDLTANVDSTMRKVCQHIGTEWSPSHVSEIKVQRTSRNDEWRERFLSTMLEMHEPGAFWRGEFGAVPPNSGT